MSDKKAISQDEIMKPAGMKSLLKQTAKEGSQGLSCALGHPVGAKKQGLMLLDRTTGPAQVAKLLVAEAKAAGSTLDAGSLRFGKASPAPGDETTIVLKLNKNPDGTMLEAVRKSVLKAGFKDVTCNVDDDLASEQVAPDTDRAGEGSKASAASPAVPKTMDERLAAVFARLNADPDLKATHGGLARRANALAKTGSAKEAAKLLEQLESELGPEPDDAPEPPPAPPKTTEQRLAAVLARLNADPDLQAAHGGAARRANALLKTGSPNEAAKLIAALEKQLDAAEQGAEAVEGPPKSVEDRLAAVTARLDAFPRLQVIHGLARRAGALLKTGSPKEAAKLVETMEKKLAAAESDEADTPNEMTRFTRRLARLLKQVKARPKAKLGADGGARPAKGYNVLASEAGVNAKQGEFVAASKVLDQFEALLDEARETEESHQKLAENAQKKDRAALAQIGRMKDEDLVDFVLGSAAAADSALNEKGLLDRFQQICRGEPDGFVKSIADQFTAVQVRDYLRSDRDLAKKLDAPG